MTNIVEEVMFCRIQNLHISQTFRRINRVEFWFCRIQNLHISQTAATDNR